MKLTRLVAAFCLLLFPAAAVQSAQLTPAQWREDLFVLSEQLPKRHKNLFFRTTQAKWQNGVRELSRRIPDMTEPEILAGLLQLVASVGDQHTGISVMRDRPPEVLPFGMYWFKDGIYPVTTSEEYSSALGCRLVKIENTDTQKACESVSALFAHDNTSALKRYAPEYVIVPQFLQALKLVSNPNAVKMTFQGNDGKSFVVTVRPVTPGPNLKMVTAPHDAGFQPPLYLKNRNAPYWAEFLEKEDLVYFQYNQCIDSDDQPFVTVRSDVEKMLREHKGAKLVIDLRHNSGGNSAVLDPFIESLKNNPDVNRKGNLFVLIGRETFSSAVLNAARLRTETNAVFIGEPTGGSPNSYGEVRAFRLPNSGLTVYYSTEYFKYMDKKVDSVAPDIAVEPTYAEYIQGQDPVLDAVIHYSAGPGR